MVKLFSSLKIAMVALFFSFCISSIFCEDDGVGKGLYQTCMACHGINAEGNIAFKSPNLSGINKWYFSSQIKKFQTGLRGTHAEDTAGKLMAPMSLLLKTDKDIDAVFNYIQTIKKDTEPKPTLGGDAIKGKDLYTTCLACHGDKGQGNEAIKSPSFKKQEDWYIFEQITKFKKDIRGYDAKDVEGKLMSPMAKILTNDTAIKDVAAYILTLK